jgi:hypothetical protein
MYKGFHGRLFLIYKGPSGSSAASYGILSNRNIFEIFYTKPIDSYIKTIENEAAPRISSRFQVGKPFALRSFEALECWIWPKKITNLVSGAKNVAYKTTREFP